MLLVYSGKNRQQQQQKNQEGKNLARERNVQPVTKTCYKYVREVDYRYSITSIFWIVSHLKFSTLKYPLKLV